MTHLPFKLIHDLVPKPSEQLKGVPIEPVRCRKMDSHFPGRCGKTDPTFGLKIALKVALHVWALGGKD